MTVDLFKAGRRIRLLSRDDVIIRPDERFTAFAVPVEGEADLLVEVTAGFREIPSGAVKVFGSFTVCQMCLGMMRLSPRA